RGAVRQPHQRSRRAAHHPRGDAPDPVRHADRAGAGGRLLGLPGLRRQRHGPGRRARVARSPWGSVRGPVLAGADHPVRGRPGRLRLARPGPVPCRWLASVRGTGPGPRGGGPMRLATVRTRTWGTRAVRVEGDALIDLGYEDVGALLASPDWPAAARAYGPAVPAADWAPFAPLVPRPGKIVCVGLNYRTHILELGRDLPAYPTLFSKYADTLVGAEDDIRLPPE